ncbi:MAG: aminoacyl-histidine dipeptidase [Fibrobacter sp.]|nr:aminoacyl-histidine dipeptidase [Fibrobacter sp.]
MPDITSLKPELLWKHFAALCKIPRPSKHEMAAARYVQEVASGLGLSYKCDDVGNVVVSKAATAGREKSPTVVLQSHLDMVPQKNAGVEHDFYKDPIIPVIDGEWVRAEKTTLGADNGIGAAAMLAVLEDQGLRHGPIEALFTVDEESGMGGVLGLKPGFITGRMLINLDSEDEGRICIGCAGGLDCNAEIISPVEKTSSGRIAFSVALTGLRGGHSGIDIHLGRGNAIKLLNRVLFNSLQELDIRLSGFYGGSVRNAIPREAFATVVVPDVYKDEFRTFLTVQENFLKKEYSLSDPDLRIVFEEVELPEQVLTEPAQGNLLRVIYACPNGVMRMSDSAPGVVETSNNLAVLKCENGKTHIQCLLRSSSDSAKDDLANAVLSSLSLAGAHVEFASGYPGWTPDPSSKLLELMLSVHENLFRRKAEVEVIHAGLECGIIGSKYSGMDMVSCGPTLCHPHSPDERVNIGSVERFWTYLKGVVERV